MLNEALSPIHVTTSALRQRLKLSLADHGWKARKRRFQTGTVTEVTIWMKTLAGGMVFNSLVCESDERRLEREAA